MSSIISDAERIRANTATMRRLGFAVEREHIINMKGSSFAGSSTISAEELDRMVKKSKFLQSKSNW